MAEELGGWDGLSAFDRALLLQAVRLLNRSNKIADADAAVRSAAEARRLLTALRDRSREPQQRPSLADYLRQRATASSPSAGT